METIQKGKQTNKQTTHVLVTKVNKQTNKQVEAAHAEAWMQGAVQSCVACRVQCTMHQSTWRSLGDALEKCRVQYAGSYSDSKRNECAINHAKTRSPGMTGHALHPV